MNNWLAIDTSTGTSSVAFSNGSDCIERIIQNRQDGRGILDMCKEVTSAAGVALANVEAIAYTLGPGSFTGVRATSALAYGLSISLNVGLLGFSTLETMSVRAKRFFGCGAVAVAIDARQGEVYWGCYPKSGGEDRLATPDAVDRVGQNYFGVGSGWGVYADRLRNCSGIVDYEADFFPTARDLIDLANATVARGILPDFAYTEPLYFRNKIAEPNPLTLA